MGAKSLLGSAASRPSWSLHHAAGGLLAAVLALAAASPAAAAQPRPGEAGGKFSSGELNAVAAVSSTDAWIVGANPNANDSLQTLVLHWDGKHCFQVPAPSPIDTWLMMPRGISVRTGITKEALARPHAHQSQ